MTAFGRFTSVPSLSGFSMFETPRIEDIAPSGFLFVRNEKVKGHTTGDARDNDAENSRDVDTLRKL